MRYREESEDLDRRILGVIETWHRGDVVAESEVDDLFLRVARYQWKYNRAYRRFVEYLQIDLEMITDVSAIPAVPASAFKEAELTTGESAQAEVVFRTSGTTSSQRGRHFMESTNLYRASSLAIFDRLVLAPRNLLDAQKRTLRFISVVPRSHERPDSSLGFMVDHLIACRGDGEDGHLLHGDAVEIDGLRESIRRAHADGVVLCLFTTALAALHLLEASANAPLPLPPGSLILETGGAKGRQRAVSPTELYARLAERFRLERADIIAEYGMTELTSQYYDLASSCTGDPRVKVGPPWLRPFIVDAEGREMRPGTAGALRHLDLANRSSVSAIESEDLAVRHGSGFLLLGRLKGAELRGCSLDAEALQTLSART
jgi:hypothetical protein